MELEELGERPKKWPLSHLDCLVIDRVDIIDTQSDANKHKNSLVAPFALLAAVGVRFWCTILDGTEVGSEIHLTLINHTIRRNAHSNARLREVVRQPSDRARCGGRPKPTADLLAQFLASKRHTVDAERAERRGRVEEPREDSDVCGILRGKRRVDRFAPVTPQMEVNERVGQERLTGAKHTPPARVARPSLVGERPPFCLAGRGRRDDF